MEEGLQLGGRDQLQLGPAAPMLPVPGQDSAVLTCLAGTIPRSKAATLARSDHRVSRGNVVVTEAPLDEELLDSNPREPCAPRGSPENTNRSTGGAATCHMGASRSSRRRFRPALVCAYCRTALFVLRPAAGLGIIGRAITSMRLRHLLLN